MIFGRLVAVYLLGLLVDGHSLGSLVQRDETRDLESFAGLLDGLTPALDVRARLLARGGLLLGDHFATLVQHQVFLHEPALGVELAAVPDLAVRARLRLLGHALGLLGLAYESLFGL